MNKIKFQHNWNRKLDCSYFTTIRKYTKEKYKYYHEKIGQQFQVELKGRAVRGAMLSYIRIGELSYLGDETIYVDTGMEIDKAMELFKRFGIRRYDLALVLVFGPVEA